MHMNGKGEEWRAYPLQPLNVKKARRSAAILKYHL